MKSYRRPLTVKFLNHVSRPGKYYDGPRSNGLRFRVTREGYKYWECRLMTGGRRPTFYLGAYSSLTLHDAREAARIKATEVRALRRGACLASSDQPPPLDPRVATVTFAAAAEQVTAARSGGWSRPEHTAGVWMRNFKRYVFPLIGSMPVSDVGTDDLVRVLEGLEALPRARQIVRTQLTAVFNWAIASRHRVDNPAAPSVLSSVIVLKHAYVHHPALPHAQVGAVLTAVRACDAWEAQRLALEFLILTAVRSGEARGALWPEIDFTSATWTVPAERMKVKMRAAHAVPLSRCALALLHHARESSALRGARARGACHELVFPSSRGRVLGAAVLSQLLKRLGVAAVPHGFRSSFRDWCGETGVEFAVSEKCLAHTVGNQVTEAYARSSLFNRRIKVMEDWAEYVSASSSERDA